MLNARLAGRTSYSFQLSFLSASICHDNALTNPYTTMRNGGKCSLTSLNKLAHLTRSRLRVRPSSWVPRHRRIPNAIAELNSPESCPSCTLYVHVRIHRPRGARQPDYPVPTYTAFSSSHTERRPSTTSDEDFLATPHRWQRVLRHARQSIAEPCLALPAVYPKAILSSTALARIVPAPQPARGKGQPAG